MRCALIVILVLGNFALASPPSPEEILQQKRPESWPEWVDVKMDASILTDETLKQEFKECFSQAPSLMLELSEEDLFGENGIYPKEADSKMERTEALVKATYWHPKKEGFSINCGIRLQGSGSLSQSSKRNFRLRFAKKFGQKSLKYSLFGSGEVEEFENLLVRNPTHDSWTGHWSVWRKDARYVNDRWALETSRELGHLSPRQEWIHLYLNGIYWGLYALSERVDEHFVALHRHEKAKEFDVFNGADLRDGKLLSRGQAEQFLRDEFEDTPEAFEKLHTYLDVPAFIDHLLCQVYQGKRDWPMRNYFLIGNRKGEAQLCFGAWDSEIGFYEKAGFRGLEKSALYYAPLSSPQFLGDAHGPGFWYRHLRESKEFRLMVADRFHELTSEVGALSSKKAGTRYQTLLDEVSPHLIAEALRWGDSQRAKSYLPYGEEWDQLAGPESWLFQRFFALRPAALKQHLREVGIWPAYEPPTIESRTGQDGLEKFYLKNNNTRGIIVYTTDGSDPREKWTGLPLGQAFREALILPSGTTIRARILSYREWSPLFSYTTP